MRRECKILNLLCVFILLFSCSKEEEEELYQHTNKGLIEFGAPTIEDRDIESRGEVISSDMGANPLTSMVVFCHNTDAVRFTNTTNSTPNWMYKADVSRADKNSDWIVSDLGDGSVKTAWKDNTYHSFFAFAPNISESEGAILSESTAIGAPDLSYQVDVNSPRLQKDLLYSSRIDMMHTPGSNGKVDFEFRHALAQLTFSAKIDYIGTNTIMVKSFIFSNVWTSGKLGFDATQNGVWNEYTPDPKVSEMSSSIANGGLNMHTLTSDFTSITATNGALMIPPQSFTTSTDSHNIGTKLVSLDAVMSVVVGVTKKSGVETETTLIFPLKDIQNHKWEMGKSYNYEFTYSAVE